MSEQSDGNMSRFWGRRNSNNKEELNISEQMFTNHPRISRELPVDLNTWNNPSDFDLSPDFSLTMIQLIEKIQFLESQITLLSEHHKTKSQVHELQKSIIQNNHDVIKNEKGKCVAFTYTGKLIATSDERVELLKKLKEMNMLNNQIFVHTIPLEN